MRFHYRPIRFSARPAFSLIELLVVIGVIALLAGILLPALSRSRHIARVAACTSNLRQIELAHTLYLNDNREMFIDCGLPHGDLGQPRRAWPYTLGEYLGSRLVIRSPLDTSRFWPASQGGDSTGLTLDQYVDAMERGEDPGGVTLARWTSYGLNNYTTRYARPSVQDPDTGRWLGPWYTLKAIPRPFATVHFVMMTFGEEPGPDGGPNEYATSDHVHASDFSIFDDEFAPAYAASQMETAAAGGPHKAARSQANYSFLDGHVETLNFADVYRTSEDNRFFPEVAH
jgi:prepilin-type N-terminal cleavage/methylation domain-containing protein/prepilin-type processing-associated H-X9-DG protein